MSTATNPGSSPGTPEPHLHIPSKEEVKEEVVVATKHTFSGLRALAAGGVGGVCAVVVGHPFDLVKVRLQTAEKGVYSGTMDVVRKTFAREGIRRGLYAGVSAPLVGVTPMCKLSSYSRPFVSPLLFTDPTSFKTVAVSFWGYDVGKGLVRQVSAVHDDKLSIAQTSAAGFFSAIPQTAITAPFERVKVLLQIQGQKQLAPGEKPKYANGFDVVRQLYRTGGIRSVFRGSAMTLARDGPGSAAYFATYEYIKRKLTPAGSEGQLSLTAIMTAGGAAGVAMWIPVFPVDTVKSRLQSAEGNPTIAGTIRELFARGGVRAFFPGLAPALARAVPANAATFLGVELAHKAMRKMFDS
ncbi:mitochondrial carrier [Xylona heveae TC161]|uniref:Mitochondrial carrier n=1 Tax=Xylona heveae (strain CBS 132557 / TC161) TaxID=1328760 RepID=A0A165IKS1_XYLHT|nr:mitochondrial carrier [Xylona heveae TC161]KZF25040.1 mitochondrial carrier [Xylona heveae TC161]